LLKLGIAGILACGRVKAVAEAVSALADMKVKVPHTQVKVGLVSEDDNGLSVQLRQLNCQLLKVAWCA
jgi:hypothetical protein